MNKYRMKMNKVCKEGRAVVSKIEEFAKRSKHITLTHKYSFYEDFRLDIDVTGNSKVTVEMMDYIKSLCTFVEDDDGDGTVWFRNYDDLAFEEEDEEKIELHLEFCVHFKK